MRVFHLLSLSVLSAALGACSSVPEAHDAGLQAPVPLTDVVQPKLAPGPSTDPTLDQPLLQARCDFSADLPIDAAWYQREQLTAAGQVALARAVLGPSAICQKIELVAITVSDDGISGAAAAQTTNERRGDDIRRFFVSRGVNSAVIETAFVHPASPKACAPSAAQCVARVTVQVRGVAR